MTTERDIVMAVEETLGGRSDVRFVVLFGSAAKRGPHQARDIDLAISFASSPSLMDLGVLAGRLEHTLRRDVDLVDLENASTLLHWEVLKNGIPVVINDARAWKNFQMRVPLEYADLQPYLLRESAGLRRVLEKARWSSSIS